VSLPGHRVTLDASAVLAWVLHERGFEIIDKVLPIAVVPVSAMVEVLYRAVERGHRLSPGQLHADLLALGLTVELSSMRIRSGRLSSSCRQRQRPAQGPCRSVIKSGVHR
jgi:ribonuclease VapC